MHRLLIAGCLFLFCFVCSLCWNWLIRLGYVVFGIKIFFFLPKRIREYQQLLLYSYVAFHLDFVTIEGAVPQISQERGFVRYCGECGHMEYTSHPTVAILGDAGLPGVFTALVFNDVIPGIADQLADVPELGKPQRFPQDHSCR